MRHYAGEVRAWASGVTGAEVGRGGVVREPGSSTGVAGEELPKARKEAQRRQTRDVRHRSVGCFPCSSKKSFANIEPVTQDERDECMYSRSCSL